jgi:plasmid stabilization system protein ParE
VTVRLTPEAEADVTEAYAWYGDRGSELGSDFLRAFDRVLEILGEHPEAYPAVHGSLRRALMHRFPYCVLYIRDPEGLVVLGCFHARRDPTAWQRRAGA